jgi:oxygen-independent coproporphyrinogen III oxidase
VSADRLGLYLHLPFCRSKCTYCHFAIDPGLPSRERQLRYFRALRAEIEVATEAPADTLFLGGGTPSLVDVDLLEGLCQRLRARHRLPDDAEVTLEANPKDLDLASLEALVALGINRLSLGAQSFDREALGEMGRDHAPGDVRRCVEAARKAGFRSVSLDLILGWPGESRARWNQGLAEVEVLQPDHVSLYLLEVSGRNLLAHQAARGRLSLPADDLVADLYHESRERLRALGLEQYEISNFARPGHESRHNIKYWADQPFLGFGMSAHSYVDGCRTWNHSSFGAYCRAVESQGGAAARAGIRTLSPRERWTEALFMALRRRQGVDLESFRLRYRTDPLDECREGLRGPFDAGLVELDGDTLRLTDKGLLLANEVFQAFV